MWGGAELTVPRRGHCEAGGHPPRRGRGAQIPPETTQCRGGLGRTPAQGYPCNPSSTSTPADCQGHRGSPPAPSPVSRLVRSPGAPSSGPGLTSTLKLTLFLPRRRLPVQVSAGSSLTPPLPHCPQRAREPPRRLCPVPLRPPHECPRVTEVASDIHEPRPRQPGCCPTTGTPMTEQTEGGGARVHNVHTRAHVDLPLHMRECTHTRSMHTGVHHTTAAHMLADTHVAGPWLLQ